MLARVQFITLGMIFLLLPSMAVRASVLIWTAVLVMIDVIFWAPVPALVFIVQVDLRFSSEVLPIVRKNTLISLMICFIVRTPDRLEVEHIEVGIFLKFVDQLNRNFRIGLRERAVVTVFAFSGAIDVWCAELRFVLVRMIELLNSVVSFLAPITFWAFFAFLYVLANFWLVCTEGTPLIFLLVVVEGASFQIVSVRVCLARVDLELSQIKESTKINIILAGGARKLFLLLMFAPFRGRRYFGAWPDIADGILPA